MSMSSRATARVLAYIAVASSVAVVDGCATRSLPVEMAVPAQLTHTYRPGIDVLDYDLSLDLPERGNVIRGRALLTVRRTAAVDTLVLDLLRLEVDTITVNGRTAGFRRTPETILVSLPKGSADSLRVTVAYHGPVEDGLIVRTDSAGRWTGFGDNWPNRARHWIPSVDHPSDKATVTWRVRAPEGRTVVANGALVERRALGGGDALTIWRESRPIPVYVMVIAAAPLVAYELGETACGLAALGKCVPQTVYVAPEQRDYAPGPFRAAGEMVRYFAELVGPFPYEKLAHLQSSTRFGGMENASAIFYFDEGFRQRRMGEELIAHETAHQWFGDAVTEREWPHVWLSEGFATYFAALWTRHAHGDSAFRADMTRMRASVLADQQTVANRPVIDTIESDLLALLNRNSYEKGGFVLHMLRTQVGDGPFFAALRRYYAAGRDGNALTDDLRRGMEATSGQQLSWFFDQWLRRPGFVEANVTWSYDPSSQQVLLDVGQSGRFGAYRFPLTVELRGANGQSRRATFEVPAASGARLTLKVATPPLALIADPDVELLGRITVSSRTPGS